MKGNDMLMLLGLTVLIYVALSGRKTVSRNSVWNSPESEDEVNAKPLNSQYGSVEDKHTYDMERAKSYKSHNDVNGVESMAVRVRDSLRNIFTM